MQKLRVQLLPEPEATLFFPRRGWLNGSPSGVMRRQAPHNNLNRTYSIPSLKAQRTLGDTTCHAVERKCGGRRVGAVIPGGLEFGWPDQRAASRNGAVRRDIGRRDRTARLREIPIPAQRNHLPVRERELQGPAVDRGCARVGDGDLGLKTPRPLAEHAVVDLTAYPGWCGRRSHSLRRCGRGRACTMHGMVDEERVYGVGRARSIPIGERAAAAASGPGVTHAIDLPVLLDLSAVVVVPGLDRVGVPV